MLAFAAEIVAVVIGGVIFTLGGAFVIGAACGLILSGKIAEEEDRCMAEEVRRISEKKRTVVRPFIQEHRRD